MHGIHLPFSLAVNKSGFESWYVQTVSQPGKTVITAELQSSGFTVERAKTQFQPSRQTELLTRGEVPQTEPVRAVESRDSTAAVRVPERPTSEAGRMTALDGKPRVYVEGTPNAWSFNNGSSGGGGSHPQLAEVMKTLGHSCPGIVVTNDPKQAQYFVTFERESKKILRKDSKLAVFNSSGDMVFSSSTRALGNGIRGFCSSLR
jgi:hypothetical protein